MSTRPLHAVTAVDALTAALRDRILEGELAPGTRLVERELTEQYDVARHTLRVALRALAGEGLVTLERHRGARVAGLDAETLGGLFDLRAALELEAAHRMLERNGGHVAPEVVRAVDRLAAVCARRRPSWRAVVDAHDAVHTAIVTAGESPRISAAYASLAGELRLFVIALQPVFGTERMTEHHRELLSGLEREGPPALRRHLDEGRVAVEQTLGGSMAPSAGP